MLKSEEDREHKMKTELDRQQIMDSSEVDVSRIGAALNLKKSDIDKIIARQQEKNILFGEAAKELGLISEKDLQKGLSEQFGFSYADSASTLNKALVAAHAPFSSEVEELRSLRGQLLIRWFNKENKTLSITSPNAGEGKSLLAANLAIVFSQLNKKTLLIDADLRQPVQHKLFSIDTKLGLTNILANREGKYELIAQKSLPNLTVLTAGTAAPNPQELLTRDAWGSLVTDLEKVYDVILIDTSPASCGDDYLAVVAKTNGAVIVARKHITPLKELEVLTTQIGVAGAKVIGGVIQEF